MLRLDVKALLRVLLLGVLHVGLSAAADAARAGDKPQGIKLPGDLLPAAAAQSGAVLRGWRRGLMASHGRRTVRSVLVETDATGEPPVSTAQTQSDTEKLGLSGPQTRSEPGWHAAWGPSHAPAAYPRSLVGGPSQPAPAPCGNYAYGGGSRVVGYGAALRCSCGHCNGKKKEAAVPEPPSSGAYFRYGYGYSGYEYGYGYGYGAYPPQPPPAAVGHGSYGGYGGYGGYDVVPQGASSSQLEAPPAIPSVVWPSLFAYLDAVVDKVIWPVLLSHTPPSMAALFKSHTSGFTLFIPQYDALAADPAVRSLMADPYHPLNAARLVDILAYHLVAGVALKASDLYDGLELVNVQGKKLLVTKPPHSDSFFLNGIELTDWVPAGEAMAIWLDGVLHDPSSGEDGSPPPAPLDRYFPAVRTALASTPGLSGTLALWDAVAADSMLGGALTALVAGPFTLLAPSDTALAAYLSAVHNNTFTTADGNNDDDDSGDGPGDGSSNGSSTSNSNSNASSHTSTTGGPATQDRGAPAAIDVGSLPPMELAAMLAPLLLTSPDTGTGFRPLAALGDGVRLATGLPAFGLPGLELQVSRHTATGMPVLAVAGVLEADGSAEEATVLAGNIYVGGGGGGAQQPQGVIHVLDRVLHSPGGGPVV